MSNNNKNNKKEVNRRIWHLAAAICIPLVEALVFSTWN